MSCDAVAIHTGRSYEANTPYNSDGWAELETLCAWKRSTNSHESDDGDEAIP
jgi:hypothetical protein